MALRTSILTETVQAFAEAARDIPPRGVSPSTLWRWAVDGVTGADGSKVKLESCKIGYQHFTSKEAIQRFLSGLNGEPVTAKTAPARRRGSAKQLDRLVGV